MFAGSQSLGRSSVPASFSGQLVKAKLIPDMSDRQNASEIEFQFNPESLSFERSIELNSGTEGRDSEGLRKISFAGPNPKKLSISNITFDTHEEGTSVLTYIDKLIETLDCKIKDSQNGGQNMRPPIYIFTWGMNQYLRCFVESLSYKITMFLPDGTPVRAVANLSLKQVTRDGIGSSKPPEAKK